MSGIKQLIVLALALPTAQAFCCFWSSTNDACECDAVASDGSWCAASEDQCLQCGDARWCDDEPEEPEDTCKGDYSACEGCGGEQCTFCAAEQDVNCCVAEGGDLYECCEASAPFSWRYSMNECDSVAHKTPEPTPAEPSCKGDYSACQGCGGEQCTFCAAEQDVNCCVAEGGDLYECCEASAPFSWSLASRKCASVAHKTPAPTPAEPSCKGDYSACQGCGGEQCTYCAAMEDIKCCLSTGADSLASDIGRVGLLQSCCDASAPFSWRYNDECQALVDDDDDDDDDTATQPPTVTPEVEWRLGDAGDSCDETCEDDGLACAEDYLEDSNAQLDFMDVLGPLGLGCTSVRGPKPNYAAPYVNHKGKCFTKLQTSTYSCSKSGSTKRRVCACSVRKHASSSGRFVASARVTPVGAGLDDGSRDDRAVAGPRDRADDSPADRGRFGHQILSDPNTGQWI